MRNWHLIEREDGEIVLMDKNAECLYRGRDFTKVLELLHDSIFGV